MLDLQQSHPDRTYCFHTATSIVIANRVLSLPRRLGCVAKVKNISKQWYLSEINFANCSRRSNLLIPQNEKIENEKKRLKELQNVEITM